MSKHKFLIEDHDFDAIALFATESNGFTISVSVEIFRESCSACAAGEIFCSGSKTIQKTIAVAHRDLRENCVAYGRF
jgi:hypothetical protein